MWGHTGSSWCRHPVRRHHFCLRGRGPVEQRQGARLDAQSLHLLPRRVHLRTRRPLTPAVGLAVQAAASSQPTRVSTACRDLEPGGDVDAGHRCGKDLVSRGAVTQSALVILACESAVRSSVASAAVACTVAAPAAEDGSWPGEAATHPNSRPCRPGRCQQPARTYDHPRPRSRTRWRR